MVLYVQESKKDRSYGTESTLVDKHIPQAHKSMTFLLGYVNFSSTSRRTLKECKIQRCKIEKNSALRVESPNFSNNICVSTQKNSTTFWLLGDIWSDLVAAATTFWSIETFMIFLQGEGIIYWSKKLTHMDEYGVRTS